MQSIKKVMREVVPPALWRAGTQVFSAQPQLPKIPLFVGNYDTWEEAASHADAWTHESFAVHARSTAHRARRGEIAFERDARPANELQWPIVTALNRVLAEEDRHLRLLDFGGSLGSLYYQCRPQLASDSIVEWRIVEQGKIARIGAVEFQNNEMRFFEFIADALTGNWQPNAVLVSGSLQYQRDAYQILEELLAIGANYFVLDRTTFISDNYADRITVQHITEMNYGRYLRLPQWLFNERHFSDVLAKSRYEIIANFDAVDPTEHLPDCSVPHRGLIARRR